MMGAHINRNTVNNIRLSGFYIEEDKNLFLDFIKRICAVPVNALIEFNGTLKHAEVYR
jgi:hypothetical protein